MKNTPATLPNHWFVFRLGHLGDVMLTTGVLDFLGASKGWKFSVITGAAWQDVFSNNPHVDSVIGLEKSSLSTAAFLRFARTLARQHPGSGLLDLHGTLRSRILALNWQGPVLRYPKMSFERRAFLASKGKLYGNELRSTNVTQRYALAVEDLPPPPEALLPKIWLTQEENAAAEKRLQHIFNASPPQQAPRPVALHPYATHSLKSWPREKWLELIAALDSKGIPQIIIGKGEPLLPNDPRDLSNTTSLRETAALLAHSRALVTGDSGPMHIACAVGTPVVALFGPTSREWGFYPAGPQDSVLELPLDCRPCSLHGKKPCPIQGKCLQDIAVKAVLDCIDKQ